MSVRVSRNELLAAVDWVSAGEAAALDCEAYVSRTTGQVYWSGEGVDEELPEDIEDGSLYIAVPHKSEFHLGRSLALRFAEECVPGSYDTIREYFHKRGAYSRLKSLLERIGKLMLQALQLIATLAATLFAGAALYINVAEHPSRMALETRTAALQWAPSYKRATLLQAPLAMLSFVSGTAAWLLGAAVGWFVAALIIGAVVPFTLVVVMPTNRKLLEPGRDLASAETRSLLEKWNKLHAVRTALSLIASIIYLWLLYGA